MGRFSPVSWGVLSRLPELWVMVVMSPRHIFPTWNGWPWVWPPTAFVSTCIVPITVLCLRDMVRGTGRCLGGGGRVPSLPPRVTSWGGFGRGAAHLANTLVLVLLLLPLLLHCLASHRQHTIPTPQTRLCRMSS